MTDSVQRYFQDSVRGHIAIIVLPVFEVYFAINKSQIHYLTTEIHQSQCPAIVALLLAVGHVEKRRE